jgi:hypothetical protein
VFKPPPSKKLSKKNSEMLKASRKFKVILKLLLMPRKLKPKTKPFSSLFTLMKMA